MDNLCHGFWSTERTNLSEKDQYYMGIQDLTQWVSKDGTVLVQIALVGAKCEQLERGRNSFLSNRVLSGVHFSIVDPFTVY